MRSLGALFALSVSFLPVFVMGAPVGHATPEDRVILVIVHKSVAVNALTRDELRPIFQTRKATWPDGRAVRPFNLVPTARARQVFDGVVLGLSPDLMPRFWIDRRVRGDAPPPRTVPSDAVMIKVVRSLPGAIGYLDAPSVDSSVKVIAKIVMGQVTAP